MLNERMDEIMDRQAAANARATLSAYRLNILQTIVVQALEADDVLIQVKCANWHNRVLGFFLFAWP